MSKRMLIDSSHPEETRVVILSGNRVEEFDFESASRKPLKGNIFLAKVTRVEPSLQAAFIEYGGNRHGFLAFNEIHPDYYQIPVADRQALIAAQRADERSRPDIDDEPSAPSADPAPAGEVEAKAEGDDPLPVVGSPETGFVPTGFDVSAPVAESEAVQAQLDSPTAPQSLQEPPAEAAEPESTPESKNTAEASEDTDDSSDDDSQVEEVRADTEVETLGGGDSADTDTSSADDGADESEAPRRSHRAMRHYKIQEVIKKRQILLVQVVKEERGNKGAALTTYLSLAGRYCVLMPNSGRGGGISRKITNSADRRRLKDAAESLDVPDGMGLIVRTAGASRTKQEIQRDYEYLLRLWDSIRDLTLRSTAPALVYEEGNLIKRAIRDQFSRDIEEIVVEGQAGYDEALTFTKMLMPQQADAVKLHDGRPPLFQKYRVESQLDSMFNPRVQLKSGGYIIINQTEALVAIDVNSGRSTREHNIEDTAHKTNLEAAEEVARQLRLRDLAGLIVIDFIDMEENRNDRAVERRLKECLRHDRARIQLGRISPFGLLEMSRQRLRPGMVEGSTVSCPHCNGTGLIRSVESLALRALRNVEEEAQSSRAEGITLRAPTEVALYILNHKRTDVAGMEERLGISIFVEAKHDMFGADCEVEIGTPGGFRSPRATYSPAISAETALAMMPEPSYDTREEPSDEGNIEVLEDSETDGVTERPRDGRGRDRRGRRRGRRDERPAQAKEASTEEGGDPMPVVAEGDDGTAEGLVETSEGGLEVPAAGRDSARDGNDRRRRRRGRRGGRRNGRPEGGFPGEGEIDADGNVAEGGDEPADEANEPVAAAAPSDPYQSEPDTTPAPVARAERKSPAAAIARFFGFGPRADAEPTPPSIPPSEAKAEVPAAEVVEPTEAPREATPAVPPPAPEPEPTPEPAAEAKAEEIAAAELPLPQPPKAEDLTPEPPAPEPAESAAPPAEASEPPAPPAAEAPVAEPAPPAPEPVAAAPAPEPPAPPPPPVIPPTPDKVEIISSGPASTGPAKAGWWKKKD